ncbi:MAG: tRNA (adenosine(37)-N6)-threonylcarbamoyltransferase complex ATPase subunit type 1 TsaE [Candidatus Yanofskybacteria bacterium]|nr:tRNA (adenosine(37)-N6)-threonylcarbamoyltransferase complex ATPase subunit type 1 TsaE [Candidatus Yanofskybacteria bacterium]
MVIYHSNSPKDTQRLAAKIARETESGVILLEGELGAGKTTFVQAFARALGVKAKVKSPTFNIIKKYKIPFRSNGYSLMAIRYLYHIDCYRLKDHKEAIPLGIQDVFSAAGGPASGGKASQSVVLIEWPERISKVLPKKRIRVHIDHIDKNKRKITISNF